VNYKFKDSDLTSEKSLWDIYKLSRRITTNKVQIFIVVFVVVALSLNAFVLQEDNLIILKNTREWAELGFSFSITTLGFLITGFTIFATLSKPKMMLAMMDHMNKETGLPTLKYNFFTFMRVFIAYILFSLVYLSIILFGQKGGFISNLLELIPNQQCLKVTLIKTAYVIIGSSFVYLLLMLKSFVFNIYATIMNFLRWEYTQE